MSQTEKPINREFGINRVVRVLQQLPAQEADRFLDRLPTKLASSIRDQIGTDVCARETHPALEIGLANRLEYLKHVSQPVLFAAIIRERPQTIAVLLSILPPQLAPRVIRALSDRQRIEVINRLSRLQRTDHATVSSLLVGLQERIEKTSIQQRSKPGGMQKVARILNACDHETERSILRSLGHNHRILREEIEQMLLCFEDITSMGDDQICTLAKNVHAETWARALKRSESDLRERVFQSLSPRAAQHVRAEMDYLGQVTPSEIDLAQQQIVRVARQLQEPQPIRRAA
ncbi:FliG C-terminal domain-containing protein [Planctomycetes bacterium K23_9]|uniref:Flagellar motor switch protein FliG n=1 Tax=Stieleria marina TaxID=1930275 RepID=A0A517NS05_9BACT|nr:Flagellar motor switch protein FliG [Planctomycetes bacterium K23_9]